jgi:hypothetical protein
MLIAPRTTWLRRLYLLWQATFPTADRSTGWCLGEGVASARTSGMARDITASFAEPELTFWD